MKKTKLIIISLIIGSMVLFVLGQIILGMGRRRLEKYPISLKEEKFVNNLEKKTNLKIYYFALPKNRKNQNINFYNQQSKIIINKHNIKKFSDSVFIEFMKVYSLKKETDSLYINFQLDSLKRDNNTFYSIDTTFYYKVK